MKPALIPRPYVAVEDMVFTPEQIEDTLFVLSTFQWPAPYHMMLQLAKENQALREQLEKANGTAKAG